jgi:metal-responsive CopG/Arc/MetJ family transcriptional regulator
MASVKTAISLDESLYKQVEALAQEMKTSRSQVFSLAVEEYLRRRRNRALLDAINAAYADGLDEEDEQWLRWARAQQRQILGEEEW